MVGAFFPLFITYTHENIINTFHIWHNVPCGFYISYLMMTYFIFVIFLINLIEVNLVVNFIFTIQLKPDKMLISFHLCCMLFKIVLLRNWFGIPSNWFIER